MRVLLDAPMSVELYRYAKLRIDVPVQHFKAGDVGTVVEFLPHPSGGPTGVMLEMLNALGESIDLVTVPETALERLNSDDIWVVRRRVTAEEAG